MLLKLKKKLEELEKQKGEIEITFYQVIGAISLVKSMIEEEENEQKRRITSRN